jgi:hypothetical protein
MFLLGSVYGGFNTGDIIFQLTMFLIFIGVPLVHILTFFVFSRRKKRLNQKPGNKVVKLFASPFILGYLALDPSRFPFLDHCCLSK